MKRSSTDLLLVVDVQNDFCADGALAVPDANAVIAKINALGKHFPHQVLTQDWHPPGHQSFASSHSGKKPFETIMLSYGEQTLWPDHCIQGTPGANFHRDLVINEAELILRKGFFDEIDSYSAFYENDHQTPTGLGGYLRTRGFNTLYLAGLATDFCVAYSALDGRKEGFHVFIIEDACRAIDLEGSLAKVWQKLEAVGVRRIASTEL